MAGEHVVDGIGPASECEVGATRAVPKTSARQPESMTAMAVVPGGERDITATPMALRMSVKQREGHDRDGPNSAGDVNKGASADA